MDEGGLGPKSAPMSNVSVLGPTEREWVVPDDWLGPDPLELCLTPILNGGRGLTE